MPHQFDLEGSSTVLSAPRIQQAQPPPGVWFPREPTVGYRPQASLAEHLSIVPSRWPRGYQDLDALNARSDRLFGSNGSARDPTQAPRIDSNPSAWGEVSSLREADGGSVETRAIVDVRGDDVFATAPADNRDPGSGMFNGSNYFASTDGSGNVGLGRRTPVKRRGLLHRLKSNGTAGINPVMVTSTAGDNGGREGH